MTDQSPSPALTWATVTEQGDIYKGGTLIYDDARNGVKRAAHVECVGIHGEGNVVSFRFAWGAQREPGKNWKTGFQGPMIIFPTEADNEPKSVSEDGVATFRSMSGFECTLYPAGHEECLQASSVEGLQS